MAVTPNSIVTPQAPKAAHLNQSFTGNTTFSTTPTNSVLLFTAGANGARLTRLKCKSAGATGANAFQGFRSLDTGTTKKYSDGVAITAVAPSGTANGSEH